MHVHTFNRIGMHTIGILKLGTVIHTITFYTYDTLL